MLLDQHETEIEVDGIVGKAPQRGWSNPFFQFKDEFDDDDDPNDTGGMLFRWQPNIVISEKHWLSCGDTPAIGSLCYKCGRLAD